MSSNQYTGGEIILKALADQDVEVIDADVDDLSIEQDTNQIQED